MGTSTKSKFGSFLLAIVLSVAGIICFYAIGIIVGLVLAFIDSDYIIIEYAISVISATILSVICEKFKSDYTKKYTYLLFGIFLSGLNVVFLVVNLFDDKASLLANIILIVIGVLSIIKGAKYSAYD